MSKRPYTIRGAERFASRRFAMEHHTERVHVGPQVDAIGRPDGLLGAGPWQRADELTCHGHRGGWIEIRVNTSGDLRQAEVHKDRLTTLIHTDVGGLDIAVDYTFQVGGVDAVAEQRGRGGRNHVRRGSSPGCIPSLSSAGRARASGRAARCRGRCTRPAERVVPTPVCDSEKIRPRACRGISRPASAVASL